MDINKRPPNQKIAEDTIVIRDGIPCRRSEYAIDFGPKNGVATVTVYDPCITEEAQRLRQEAIVRCCQDLMRRGEMW